MSENFGKKINVCEFEHFATKLHEKVLFKLI